MEELFMSSSGAVSGVRSTLTPRASFAALCAKLYAGDASKGLSGIGSAEFPLRGKVTLRSRIGTRFEPQDFAFHGLSPERGAGQLPLLEMSVLTLAGSDGPLPWWVAEKVEIERQTGGKALHQFLDLLNRRFWELLFMTAGMGHQPHISYANKRHYDLLDDLSFAVARLDRQPELAALPDGVAIVHAIRRLAWAAPGMRIDSDDLPAMLSRLCGQHVRLRKRWMLRLPIAQSCQIALGPRDTGFLSRRRSVIGQRALVYGGLRLEVTLSEPGALPQFLLLRNLAAPNGQLLKLLVHVLKLFYSQSLPALALRIQCPWIPAMSALGAPECRLGCGAAVAFAHLGEMSLLLTPTLHNDVADVVSPINTHQAAR
jgi:predicted component of type VI protein secretion system